MKSDFSRLMKNIREVEHAITLMEMVVYAIPKHLIKIMYRAFSYPTKEACFPVWFKNPELMEKCFDKALMVLRLEGKNVKGIKRRAT